MNIPSLSQQARQAMGTRETANDLRRQAAEKRNNSVGITAQANAEIKAVLKNLNQEDEVLQQIVDEETQAKGSERYKESEKTFNDVKQELGLSDLVKSKKERNAELKDQANRDPTIAQMLTDAQAAEIEAQKLEDQAAALEPAAEATIDEIISTLALGQIN